jgi:small-conductance mechanosensitive channel
MPVSVNRFCVAVQRSLKLGFFNLVAIVFLLVTVSPLLAQEVDTTGNKIDGYPVVLDNKVLFRIKQGIPNVATAEERANLINQRLEKLVESPVSPDDIKVEEEGNGVVVKANDSTLFTVREGDEVTYKQPRQALARQAAETIKIHLKQYQEERKIEHLILGSVLALLSTFLLVAFLKLQEPFFARIRTQLRAARRGNMLDLRIRNVQLLGSDATSYLLDGIVQLLRMLLIAGVFYLYIPFVLKQFPPTRSLGERILGDVGHQGNSLIQALVKYLPNLITIAIIGVLTYFILGFIKLVIVELGRDNAYSWFYPEWIQPSNRIATFLMVALACVIAAPYLPGFGSPAFQGVSIFLGALLSLGASSTVANAIAGTILVYTRAFQLRDIVKVGDITGEVIESSLFVTRLLTFKQEIITIPNSTVISSHVTNFSSVLRRTQGHLLLHTTITLGYDAPWRKVHEVLIEAAKATKGIIPEPAPFILQTSLNDFHISYEINAFTDNPEIMPQIYSNLHQNIQDYCNQADIEILSPAFSALRDGNHTTIPANYLPTDYTAPTFQIRQRNDKS